MKITALNKVNKTLYLCKIDNFEYEASSIKITKRIKTIGSKTNIINQYIFLFNSINTTYKEIKCMLNLFSMLIVSSLFGTFDCVFFQRALNTKVFHFPLSFQCITPHPAISSGLFLHCGRPSRA